MRRSGIIRLYVEMGVDRRVLLRQRGIALGEPFPQDRNRAEQRGIHHHHRRDGERQPRLQIRGREYCQSNRMSASTSTVVMPNTTSNMGVSRISLCMAPLGAKTGIPTAVVRRRTSPPNPLSHRRGDARAVRTCSHSGSPPFEGRAGGEGRIVTPEGEVKALDSKFTVDDSALYRHPDIAELRDTSAADPLEALAREKGVTYVKLDGTVGILGNGAGLSMSTVDVVVTAGGKPANFCDLGGGGDAEGVVDALEVITRDPQVRSIFFNIFGGITRCDEVARGILEALDRIDITVPIVVRLDGTNAEEGLEILADAAPPNLHVAPTMLEAARLAVELAANDRCRRQGSTGRPGAEVPAWPAPERGPLE